MRFYLDTIVSRHCLTRSLVLRKEQCWILKSRGGSRGRVQGVRTPPPTPEITCGFLIQLVFCQKKTIWLIGAEVEQEMSAPPPRKNPGSAPEINNLNDSG